MKTNMLKQNSVWSGVLGVVALSVSISVNANSISGGAITMNIDANALASIGTGSNEIGNRHIFIDEYFGSAYYNDLVTEALPTAVDSVAADSSAMQANINGSTITPVAGRSHKETTLSFDNTLNDGTATGQIGTNGVIRISSDIVPGLAGSYLVWDDMGIDYSAAGGWGMFTEDASFGKNYVFDLINLNETLVGNALTLSGDLVFTTQTSFWPGFIGIPAGTDLGSFSLETTTVPVPAAVWLFGTALFGLLSVKRKNAHMTA